MELFITLAAVVLLFAILKIAGYSLQSKCEHKDCERCPFPRCEESEVKKK